MNPVDQNTLVKILIWLIPGVYAITLHEIAHGWMALLLGDTTARDMKRLSLNPLRHIDPLGTIIIPGLMLLAQVPFVFGWAKPVPVNFRRLKGGRKGALLVALAGPMANLAMLLGWMAFGEMLSAYAPQPENGTIGVVTLFSVMAAIGVVMNLALILFNLIPIPPLDGGRILGAVLPEVLQKPYRRLERFGILLLLVLIATGVFRHIFDPVVDFFLARLPMMP